MGNGKLSRIFRTSEGFPRIMFKWKGQNGHYEISKWRDEGPEDGYGHVWFGVVDAEERREILKPARRFLCDMLNFHLQGIAPALDPGSGFEVRFVPRTPLDALWLMFTLEVDGTVRSCWHCGGSLEPTRKDNIYCSKNCKRMAHYHKKQKRGTP